MLLSQAANKLNITRRSAKRLFDSGKLKGKISPRGIHLISQADIQNCKNNHQDTIDKLA